TYKAIEFGRGARIPRAPQEVLRHRYGDCKDHALLLYHLLRNAGTEARLALVRTGSPVRRELPSLDQFDHMVVYLPGTASFVAALQRRLSVSGHAVEVLALDVRDLREPQKPFSVQVKYIEHGAFHAVGGQLVGRIPALLERGRIDVEREERETPFEFPMPLTIHSAVSLQLPSGYAPAHPLSRRASADGPFAAWKMI